MATLRSITRFINVYTVEPTTPGQCSAGASENIGVDFNVGESWNKLRRKPSSHDEGSALKTYASAMISPRSLH